jgi:protein TonB
MSEKYKHNEQLEDVLRYMNGTMPEAERYAFERALEQDPFLMEAFEGLSEIKASEIDRDIRSIDVISGKKRLSLGILKYAVYAASVALFIIAGFWAVKNIDFSKQQTAKTETENPEFREPYKPVQTDTIDSLAISADSSKMMIADAGLRQPGNAQMQTVGGVNTLPGQQALKEKPFQAKDAAKKKSASLSAAQQTALKAEEETEIATATDQESLSEAAEISTANPTTINESREDIEEPFNALKRPGVNANPQPLGGNSLFKEYLDKNAKYPAGIQNAKKELVKVKFKISKVGQPFGIVVEKSPDQEFSREAIRLILDGPKWSPEIKDGIPVEGEASVKIYFDPKGK